MLSAGALLISLSILTIHGQGLSVDRTPPSRPPKIISKEFNDQTVNITWEHVEPLANEESVDGYKVLYRQQGHSAGTLYTTSRRYIELPLHTDGNYVVEVRAHSEGGDGAVAKIKITAEEAEESERLAFMERYTRTQVACASNPCFNGGACRADSTGGTICTCSKYYTGDRCQTVKNICENVTCVNGDCLVDPILRPYYECKCKFPFSGRECKTIPLFPCLPNPCQNGGTCVGTHCLCPDGYSGKFCTVAASDCYEGNGEEYRGKVSTTEQGMECLHWHSNFVLLNAGYTPRMYPALPAISGVNSCSNPDGDEKPWCFIKKGNKLDWDYCNIKKCPEAKPARPVNPNPAASPFSECGKTDIRVAGRYFGQSRAYIAAHPWQVSVQMRPKGSSSEFRHTCGGALLSSCWVLTAANCLQDTHEYQVVLGGGNLDKQEDMDQTIPVIQTIVHENYTRTQIPSNDIALLQLQVTDSPYCAKETRFVKKVCLPDENFPAGKQCGISGWWFTEPGTAQLSSKMLNANMMLISEEQCRAPEVHGDQVDKSMLCASHLESGGIDSCQGNSGNPLVCVQTSINYIAGVESWSDACGENKPAVYANVYSFVDWIRSRIN